jgi:8-oxo-dGTP pyrophosphatase MutT (NUDIX family)
MESTRKRLPVSVSSAVFIEDAEGRLLLLKQAAKEKGGKWGPPAGGMEPHEDPRMTAIREAREEIGVEVELIDLIGIYTVDRGSEKSGLAFVFRGKIVSGEIAPAEGEITEYRFFTPDEIAELTEKGLLYKPEYNQINVQDWLDGKSYPLDSVTPM